MTRTRRALVAALLASLWSATVAAEELEHLVPETGEHVDLGDRDYKTLLLKHFPLRNKRWIQLVILPSRKTEEMISLEGDSVGTALLVHMRATKSIYHAYDRKHPDVEIPVERHEATLPSTLQARLIRCWTRFLLRTRYPRAAEWGFDGTTYHFGSFDHQHGVLTGETWSPSPTSLPGLFVEIGTLLGSYADAAPDARGEIERALGKAIVRAERRLGN